MGLIKAGMGALGGTLADQWKEFFYCDALDKDVLMVKGQKRTSRRSSNHGEDNIITNGSGIAVADGQCMLIAEQGRVVEVCAEPGEFTFDASTEPSVFTGNFGDSLAETFQTVAKRFTYGGDTGKDQRVYYINTKELGEILYGTATPIPFRVVVSEERGYKLSVNLRCNGSFTCRICDPLLFYTNVCSNVSTQYDASEIAPRLKSELMNALQPALATLSANKVCSITRSPPTRWRSPRRSTSSCPASGAKSAALRCSPSTSTPCPSRRSSRRRSPSGKKTP